MEGNVTAGVRRTEEKRRNPRIENFVDTFRLFLKSKLAFAGFVITLIYFAIAILDAVYPQYLGVQNISNIFSWPTKPGIYPTIGPTFNQGWWYYFGTTEYSLPLLPLILAAVKFDIQYSLIIVMVGAGIGIFVGTFAAYFGGLVDEIVMRITDIFFSVPYLVLTIAIAFVFARSPATASLGLTGIRTVVVALIIVWWPTYARLSRSLALSVKTMKYVEAATASGSSRIRNIFAHVMPNVLSPAFVQISLDLGTIIQIFAAIDFLGFNFISPTLPEIGNLLSVGQNFILSGDWWAIVMPGIFLLFFTISINLMGDGLRDVLDPRLRR